MQQPCFTRGFVFWSNLLMHVARLSPMVATPVALIAAILPLYRSRWIDRGGGWGGVGVGRRGWGWGAELRGSLSKAA